MGGRGPAEGRKPGGKRGSLRLFVFAREGGEGRADTRAFALGYGAGGAARAPPARPGEDKGAAGDEEEEGDYYFAGFAGGGSPPVRPASPSPSWTLQGPSRPRGHPRGCNWGTLREGEASRPGAPGAPETVDTVDSGFPARPWACVCFAGQSAAPPPFCPGSGPRGQRGCSRTVDGGARGRVEGPPDVLGCVVTQPPILFSFVERKKGVGVMYQLGFSHFCS